MKEVYIMFAAGRYSVYIAGKMGGRLGKDVLVERLLAKSELALHGIAYVDPADGENIAHDKVVDLQMDYVTMKNFVAKDEDAIRSVDALLILTGDTPSEGTGLEFGLALQLGKPVILVGKKRCNGELMGFWNIKCTAMFPTVAEAAKFIKDNFAQKEVENATH